MQRIVQVALVPLCLVLLLTAQPVTAFTTTTTTVSSLSVRHHHALTQQPQFKTPSQNSLLRLLSTPSSSSSSSSTQLKAAAAAMSSLAASVATISPITRAAALLVVLTMSFATFYKRRRAFLFQTDPTVNAPLPDGTYGGCPLFGSNVLGKSKKTGLTEFYTRASAAIGNPGIFKCLTFGNRLIVVNGSKLTKQVLSNEFVSSNTGTGLKSSQMVTGKYSLLYSQQEKEHNYLRRLIGQAMTPEAITKAIPTLESVIAKSLDEMVQTASLSEESKHKQQPVSFVMEDVCTKFTLDVAHSQILGLDLRDEELIEFRQRVNDWIWGSFSPRVMFLPFTEQSNSYKARLYLVDKITRKIEKLRANGDDGSTLSAMVFAKDEESQQRLTDIEIIDNALLLILAGSETSASTLTNAILFLGLHPEIYRKVQEEQDAVIQKYNGNTDFTRTILDKEFPYLEAVIKETMRIRPLANGAMRIPKETMVLDGKQIPKGVPIAVSIQLTHELDPLVYDPNGQHMDIFTGFKPERWLDPETRPAADYMPFGYGPRYCLGANLAMAEMKLFLAMFARRVQSFELVCQKDKKDNNKPNPVEWKQLTIIPKPADGSEITIQPFASSTRNTNSTVVLDGVFA